MKRTVCIFLCCWITSFLQAQAPKLAITTDKTTSLIFPYPVRHVDRGTADVLVQPVKGAQNILLLKAACAHFPETNLSVVTEDGSLFSFLVTYQSAPALWTYEIPAKATLPHAAAAAAIRDNPPALRGVRAQAWGLTATLQGIYIHGSTMYYQLRLENDSPIDYPIDYLRFFIRDRKKARRSAVQEVPLHPLHITGNTAGIRAFSAETLVIALQTFTIPDARYLSIEVGEKSGGRHLALRIGNRKIMNAILLPDKR